MQEVPSKLFCTGIGRVSPRLGSAPEWGWRVEGSPSFSLHGTFVSGSPSSPATAA